MLRCLSIILLVVLSNLSIAQDEFRLERVRTIPNTATVNDILVQGNLIYIAASTGLYTIDSDDLETRLISDKSIDAVCHVVKGQVWASVGGRYIQNMTTGETTLYNSPGIEIRDLEYSKGKIWIASNQGILTVLTRSNELGRISFSKKSGLPSNNVSFIHIDNQKRTWIGTDSGIVFINEKEKWKTYEKKLKMEAMHYNHEGLWLVSNKEMWVIDPYNRWYPAAIDKGLRKGEIRDITADSTGRLYMASEILVRYDPYEETIESYADNTAIVSKGCTAVESDRDNRIWLGTKGGGLFLFGYADQAKTIEDLVEVRDRKMANGSANSAPEVEVAIVKSDLDEKLAASDVEMKTNTSTNTSVVSATKNEIAVNETPTSAVASINSAEGVSRAVRNAKETKSTVDKKDKKITSSKMKISTNVDVLINCPGEQAVVNVAIEGGEKPYKIIWNDGVSDATSRSLDPGSYRIVAEDSLGQSISTNIIIDGKQALELKAVNKKSPTAEGRLDGNVKRLARAGMDNAHTRPALYRGSKCRCACNPSRCYRSN